MTKDLTITKDELWHELHREGMAWSGASRIINALIANKVLEIKGTKIDLGALRDYTYKELLKLRGVGRKGMSALEGVTAKRKLWIYHNVPSVLKKWRYLNANCIQQSP